MKRLVCFWLLTALPSAVLSFAIRITSYSQPGDINIMTPSTSNPTSIVWKHDGNLVAEWMNSEIKFNETFKGRTTLNTTTGELVITDVHRADRGLYTVEINGYISGVEWIIEVLERVPEPEVLARPLTCSFNSDNCNLTCHGNTTGAGTVTYSWREDGGEWKEGERDKTIVNNEELKSVKTFYCQMKNEVSPIEWLALHFERCL
uniref:Ig-like domain-containing protein n=1 Tax=Lates calcarifer TaxID=8187 RepID=A0A4W6FXW9_LATCA